MTLGEATTEKAHRLGVRRRALVSAIKWQLN